MLSLQDCLDFSDLSQDEIDAIADHEHLTPIVAAELGSTLLQTNAGMCLLKLYLLESIERARLAGDFDKARHLDEIYQRFDHSHISPGSTLVQ